MAPIIIDPLVPGPGFCGLGADRAWGYARGSSCPGVSDFLVEVEDGEWLVLRPAEADDLSDQELFVTSIYGTNDGVTSLDEISDSELLLPKDTDWIAIEGGNHSQFGWYGPQSGDNPADISREVQ